MVATTYTTEYNDRRCFFTFKDGKQGSGVITSFTELSPNTYYFIPTARMHDFRKYQNDSDTENMLRLAIQVELDDILTANLI